MIDAGHDGRTPSEAAAASVRHSFVMRCSTVDSAIIHPPVPRLRPADLPRIGELAAWAPILPSWRAAFPPDHPDHFPGDDAAAVGFLMPLIDGSELGPMHRASTLLVDESDVPVAGIIVTLRSDDQWVGPWIADIWRDPALRGNGVGPLLITRAKELLAEDGHATLSLAVTKGNHAKRAYEREGFSVVRESWVVRLPGEPD